MSTNQTVRLLAWSPAADTARAARAAGPLDAVALPVLPLDPARSSSFHAGRFDVPVAGTLVLRIHCPRALRLWIDTHLLLDEEVPWRSFQREIDAVILLPCEAGPLDLTAQVGPRPRHPQFVQDDCPSRVRDRLMANLAVRFPDQIQLEAGVLPGVTGPAASLRFLPDQFVRDGVTYQQIRVRPNVPLMSPQSTHHAFPAEAARPELTLRSSILPGDALRKTPIDEEVRGLERCYVPVAEPENELPVARTFGPETDRLEPAKAVVRQIELTVTGPHGSVTLNMPCYEATGRHAPRREFRPLVWPDAHALRAAVPQPVLPDSIARYARLYDAAWDLVARLVRHPEPESGLPGSFIRTSLGGFPNYQFVWDTSFTTIASAYGWRALHAHASLDTLYSRQNDGGYIHREQDTRDGLPVLYEPDFSPNPPIMSQAEWKLYCLTGDLLHLRAAYPVLMGYHRWVRHNRRLPDGTYWTTGLANGLDNSPSMGDGYPDLSAQMAHDAQTLARIARILGRTDEADELQREYHELGQAINRHLWSDSMGIYSTSLAGGGHNPNKVVTAFWPLWAGVVPPQRVQALADHLQDPRSFWRHHPIPSLAADSPHYKPGGNYWLGSTWAPTNYAAIKGFARSGRLDLARRAALRHLQCMYEVFEHTGCIWENYCAEESRPGNWSQPHYCWSVLGPIALLLEVILGIEIDTPSDPATGTPTIRFSPPADQTLGVRRLPVGKATIDLVQKVEDGGARRVEVKTDRRCTIEIDTGRETLTRDCPPGATTIRV